MSSNQPKIDGVFRTRSLGAAASGEESGMGESKFGGFEISVTSLTFEAECNIIPPGDKAS